MTLESIWIGGRWQAEPAPEGEIQSYNPRTGAALAPRFPVSGDSTLRTALRAGRAAAEELRGVAPERIAMFLERCAANLEAQRDALVDSAHLETGLPKEPRLRNVELPRTVDQLRQAAAAARSRSFCDAHIDTKLNIRSLRGPLGGPVAIFGPNNFPFAFNAMLGGDFAAALAAGNPVIAKAHPGQLSTTRLLAQAASEALLALDLPPATVQLLYALPPELGLELVAHPELGASAFTGSRRAGLRLKAAADLAGKPIYLEMSAINPVFVLPGALRERASAIARELASSCTMGSGQFCTKPGLSVVLAGDEAEAFRRELGSLLAAAPAGTLLAAQGAEQIQASLALWTRHGAQLDQGGKPAGAPAFGFENTLASATGRQLLEHPEALQAEAFGPVHLLVSADGPAEMESIATRLEGSLTGCIYSHTQGEDDAQYERLAARLRSRVGRLLNDKMPTGVAVSPAMNHGGPYPATGHPGFTSVGLPSSIARFTALHCYDQVREPRLPPELRDRNPGSASGAGRMWRCIDGEWTQADVSPKAS
jgi:alpha-ketoglutaric semialdehyde dehydrogenase